MKTPFRDGDYIQNDVLRPKFVKASRWRVFPHMVTGRRGTTSKKKIGTIRVLKGVPLEMKEFRKNIDTLFPRK